MYVFGLRVGFTFYGYFAWHQHFEKKLCLGVPGLLIVQYGKVGQVKRHEMLYVKINK